MKKRIEINKNELSGAFGDIGTDLPLIIGMLMVTDLKMSNVLVIYGILQIITAFIYGIPMPVQPLKAVAMIVITQKISSDVIFGGGFAIGIVMLFLVLTGLISWLNRIIPKTVVRGIQLGLGIQLSLLAMKEYIPGESWHAYLVAGVAFMIALVLIGNRKFPPALIILGAGILYSLIVNYSVFQGIHFSVPVLKFPVLNQKFILTGLVVLAVPQIPLSLGNSIFASKQLANDLFPEKKISVTKLGITYSLMNLLSSFFGGIPVCHGSGGIAGHFTFGGRTGGSTFIYGIFYLLLGIFFSSNSVEILTVFPKPVLGIILLFEGIALIILVKDIITEKKTFFIAIIVAVCSNGLQNGYFIGLVLGTILYYLSNKYLLKHYGKQ